jgi:surface protein
MNNIYTDCNSLISLPYILINSKNNNADITKNMINCLPILEENKNNILINSLTDQLNDININNNTEITAKKEINNKNRIKGILNIGDNDLNNDIILFSNEMDYKIDFYIYDKKINLIRDNNKWIYNFIVKGEYSFEIIFNDKITNLKNFFENCYHIISLDLSNFNTSNVINMEYMFSNCNKLKEIKGLNNFKTMNVTNMSGMFQQCENLEYLDLSNFNTSKVIYMEKIFYECKMLKEIKGLNNLITTNVINMNAMFEHCYDLEYLDLSNFDTSNVINMESMFNECNKLKEIKGLNNFITNNVTNMNGMFQLCNELE